MARQSKPQEEEADQGAPEWMVTFSDCMTLLLTFFVLLLSFSSFDNKVFSKLQVIYSTALDSITPLRHDSRDALNQLAPIKYVSESDNASEKPTLSENQNEGLLNEQLSSDLNDGVVLLLPSMKIFFGEGKLLSPDGRKILDDMASYLAQMPNRIVISERSPGNKEDTEYRCLERAWAVMDYFGSKKNIDKNRLSVSISGTITSKNSQGADSESENSGREIEISLLQRSIYN
jgi:chemotaxis protein MotB